MTYDEFIRILFQVPIHVLLLVTFIGMWSLNWGRFCKIMFALTLYHVISLHLIIKPHYISNDMIAYYGAIIAGCSGSALGFFNVMPKEKTPAKIEGSILVSLWCIICLLLVETLLNLRVQSMFNNGELKGSFTHAVFKYLIVTSTICQIIFLRKGGYDGLSKLRSGSIDFINSLHIGGVADNNRKENTQTLGKRKEKSC